VNTSAGKTAALVAQHKPRASHRSNWMRGFFEKPAPSIGQAIAIATATN
jgi:hypothetical protein